MRLAASLLLAAASFSGSDRAALQLAIAGTRLAPPDLSAMIVKYRKEFLAAVREAARRPPPADFEREARAISRSILARAPFSEAIARIGAAVGGVLSAELSDARGSEAAFESASAGPYRIPGVSAASASGDPGPAARSIRSARADLAAAPADAAAARIVADETNLLWAIWTGAGGDARPAKKLDERNGPYVVDGAPR
ncbi:MAG TPA: hypothetical protein VFS34_04645 [Thermoanaerobaculia bacterium]|nr:hypothetical protein [Thermoanaerobaculia bacterium]